jgi:signal transduction histidine kinase
LRIGLGQVAEIGAILLGALGLNTVFWNVGLSFQAMPLMLAVAWIGLRQGRAVTWSVLVLVTLLMLPFTALPVVGRSLLAGGMADLEKIHWHLGLASIVIVGYLAASYSDAESAALEALDRRNRLLLQADRLKTLRAMSVSVIHEISQPLTTLAIEARHLRHMTDGTDDLAESVRRIDGKAQGIATLVRRLRRFGERGEVAPALIAVRYLVEAAADLAGAEFRAMASNWRLRRSRTILSWWAGMSNWFRHWSTCCAMPCPIPPGRLSMSRSSRMGTPRASACAMPFASVMSGRKGWAWA